MHSQNTSPKSFSDKLKFFVILISMAIFCFLTYANCLHNEFLMDDYPRVLNNADFRQVGFSPFNLEILRSQIYLRPVTDFFNFVTLMFFGDNPLGYHLINLTFFILAATAIYLLVLECFNNPSMAVISALLFCAHPINSVAVNYKNATSFAFLILAICLSIIKYIRFIKTDKKISNLIMSLAWFVLAIFSHEVAVAYPLYLLTAIYVATNTTFKKATLYSLPFFVLVVLFVITRSLLLSKQANVYGYISTFDISFFGYITHFTKLVGWYLNKLLTLQGIVLAWNTPIVGGFSYMWILGFILLLTTFTYLVFSQKLAPQYRFAVAWIFIGFLPVGLACFSRPFLGFVIQPHWLFFSSIGFFVLLAAFLIRFPKWITIIALIIMLSIWTSNTRRYNYLWGTEQRYCHYWLAVSPNSFWPNFWLGHYYINQKQYQHAETHYKKIVTTPFKQKEINGNLGIIALKQNKFSLAEQYFLKLQRLDPADALTYYYLGVINLELRQFRKAENLLRRSAQLDPYLITTKEALIKLYTKTKRPDLVNSISIELHSLKNEN